jgi:hypothetical protein
VETFPQAVDDAGKARDKAGERMNVSGRTVDDAAKVIASAVPEVMERVRSGDMTISEAKRVVKLNPQAQKRIASNDSKKGRAKEIESAFVRSIACKQRDAAKPPMVPEPGTSFVRKYLSTLDRLTMLCAEHGFKDGVSIAAAFDRDMDWGSDVLSMQYDRIRPVLDAIAIIERFRKAA